LQELNLRFSKAALPLSTCHCFRGNRCSSWGKNGEPRQKFSLRPAQLLLLVRFFGSPARHKLVWCSSRTVLQTWETLLLSTWFGGRYEMLSWSRATRGSSGKGKPPLLR